jgi:delta 1-pyrroline-5-carboxylate dehydrogenase
MMKPRLYLRVGDTVRHIRYYAWGKGVVVEESHSTLAGGFCLVRVLFEDGAERSFINDLDNECCCYYAGLRAI